MPLGVPEVGVVGVASGTSAAVLAAAKAAGAARLAEGDAAAGPSPRHRGGPAPTSGAARAVVEVFAAHAAPNFLNPYQGAIPEFSRSTSFVVDGQLLLTNAHCVAFATHVQVKRRDQDTRFVSDVVCIGFECDLALLAVRDAAFWEGAGPPIRFVAGLPAAGTSVTVLGFGQGGDNLCTTKGVVSRIDVQPYPWARGRGVNIVHLPVIQIDAAINPGNSGGPALADSSSSGGASAEQRALGVAFMGLAEAQNIGFIIPAQVALHFLEDFRRNQTFTHFGHPPFHWQSLETQDMREYFRAAGHGGVRVTSVDPNVDSGLRVDDVVVRLFGEPVGYDGKVAVRLGESDVERVSLWYLFCDKFTGTTCDCTVRRDGKELELAFPVVAPKPLVAADPAAPNEFLIVAGLVLQPLTSAYIVSAEAWHSYEVQQALRGSWARPTEGRQVVIVTGVLSHEVNAGMPCPREDVLRSINGEEVRSLRHAAELVDRTCEAVGPDSWLVLEFSSRVKLVVRTAAVVAAQSKLLERHCLQADRFLWHPASKLPPSKL